MPRICGLKAQHHQVGPGPSRRGHIGQRPGPDKGRVAVKDQRVASEFAQVVAGGQNRMTGAALFFLRGNQYLGIEPARSGSHRRAIRPHHHDAPLWPQRSAGRNRMHQHRHAADGMQNFGAI